MSFGASEPKGSKSAGKNAALMRRMFLGEGEPYYTSLLSALADIAGISPYSLFGNNQNGQAGGPGQQPQQHHGPIGQALMGPIGQLLHHGDHNNANTSHVPTSMPPVVPPNLASGGGLSEGPFGFGTPGGVPQTQRPGAGPAANMAPAPMARSPLMGVPGQVSAGVEGANVGQGQAGVIQGSTAAPATQPPLYSQRPINPLPNPADVYKYGTQSPIPHGGPLGSGPGWTDADRISFQQGSDAIQHNFDTMGNQAMYRANGQNNGGNSSIAAGLQNALSMNADKAMGDLGLQTSMAGVQRQGAALNSLLQALMPMMGYPGQAGQLNLGQGQMQQQAQQANNPMQYLQGLAGWF